MGIAENNTKFSHET